ncbi:helix-turn-helix domain-containing protein [Streptomyces sp. NPDC052036]|uniref:helix-turn-helix domain-containing protein n=1 Tax=Streptomyces sp. NPDC052036 TaxID=3155171 RepID=UPI0034173D11
MIGILEAAALSPRGVTLAELAAALDAAKSSVQELTNGLLARGYLIEGERPFHLGPGPFVLAARANKPAALSLDHPPVPGRAQQGPPLHRTRRGARRRRPRAPTMPVRSHPA